MPKPARPLQVVTLLGALSVAAPARSQVAPWSEPPLHGVTRAPAPPPPHALPSAVDDERPAPSPPADSPEAVRPISNQRVGTQATVGLLAGAGGLFLGALAGIPVLAATRSEQGFFVAAYAGCALASAGAVTAVGRGFHGDGDFGRTLLGASVGATAGWALHFWAFERADDPPVGAAVIVAGLLTVTGAIVGYSLSASSAGEIAARSPRRALLAPSLAPVGGGAVLGLAGSL